MVRFLLVLLVILPTLCMSEPAAESGDPIRIGLIHFSPPLSNDMDFGPSLQHLQEVFAPRKVIAKVYSSDNLEKAVEDGSIDFFYASSGFYYRMLPFGARDIATVVTREKPMPNFGTAGAFITRRDRTDIKTFEDMKGKTFAANYPSAFHGYRIGMAELERKGYDYQHFFKSVHFVGESAPKLLEEVTSGKTDVAFIRACWLEEHELQNISVLDKIKVIGARPGPIACLHSTRAYPNNTFAATYRVDPELARRVAVALLSMKPSASGQHWSIATDFKPVDDLYRSLKAGPYEYLNIWSVRRVIQEFWPFLLIAVLAVLGLIVHSWRAEKLIARATGKLLREEKRRKTMEQRAQLLTEKMEVQQKINLVGQLSSMFAHEMNQPLAACKYFIDGLKALRKRGQAPTNQILDYSLTQMDKEIHRASQIVDKVREYSKQTDSREQSVNLSEILEDICRTLSLKFSDAAQLRQSIQGDVVIEGDPVECQVLCWNLVKNALEAASKVTGGASLSLTASESEALLTICNDGAFLTEDQVRDLKTVKLKSEKKEGLGLGITVVLSILEAMGTTAEFAANRTGGLTVCVKLNLKK